MFQYKTLRDTSPQGKRRVYFTSHPEDHAACFEEISQALVEFRDCAVWFCLDEVYEDIETDLGQMSLLVVPVTRKLLTQPCRAMDVDVPFALSHHIPILPILQEGGLDGLYAQRFGDLQYLDRRTRDDTAISYESKLDRYISDFLSGTDLNDEIRGAFSARIFLSYRKKDRRSANVLMRRIHADPRLRDVAIWYDEYLTPGEDFKEEIAAALAESDLFLMLVTPNLVNEINYVQTVEYPAALSRGMRILPVVMEPTDPTALVERFPGLPPSVDGTDPTGLASVLENSLRDLDRWSKHETPEHNYLLGLAYLTGLDVEVDHQRALDLLSSSAEAENLEAMGFLISMYRNGFGVERDYRRAADWQQRVVLHWERVWKASGDFNDLDTLLDKLLLRNSACVEIRDYPGAEAAALRACELCEAWMESGEEDLRRDLGIACARVGDVRMALDDPAGAEPWYRRDLALNEALAAENSGQASQDLAIACEKVGDVLQALGRLEEAEAAFRRSLEVLERLSDADSADVRRERGICLGRLTEIRRARGDLPGAEAFAREEFDLALRLAQEEYTVDARHNLGICCSRLADLRMEQGAPEEAEVLYQHYLSLFEALVEETGTVDAKRETALACGRLGDLFHARGEFDRAEEYLQKDLAICEALARETGTVDARRNLTSSCFHLAELRQDQGKLEEAEALYRRCLSGSLELLKQTGTVQSRRDAAVSYGVLGDLYAAREDLDGAEACYLEELGLGEELAKETGTPDARQTLAVCCSKLGSVLKDRGDFEQAEEYLLRALALNEELAKETGTPEARRNLSVCCSKLGNLFYDRGDPARAEEFYRRDLALSEELAKETGTPGARDNLAHACWKLGGIGSPADRKLLERALALWTDLARECPQNSAYAENRDRAASSLRERRAAGRTRSCMRGILAFLLAGRLAAALLYLLGVEELVDLAWSAVPFSVRLRGMAPGLAALLTGLSLVWAAAVLPALFLWRLQRQGLYWTLVLWIEDLVLGVGLFCLAPGVGPAVSVTVGLWGLVVTLTARKAFLAPR